MTIKGEIAELNALIEGKDAIQATSVLSEMYVRKATFSTSFGLEDQAISHFIFTHDMPVRVFTLDTGRLFPETYNVWNKTLKKYGQSIEVYGPKPNDINELVKEKGPNLYYESVEDRKACCHVRKVIPLNEALQGTRLWITGIRSGQSANRATMERFEYDADRDIIKFHPLLNWTTDELKAYIKKNNVPYNLLHDKGFPSIGCQPCTRAVLEGEDERAGRWWWEDTSKKECGLHAR